jgi:hypothetical protein
LSQMYAKINASSERTELEWQDGVVKVEDVAA